MLERVPEVEAMDTPEEAREYAAMDHREANEAFVQALERHGCAAGDLLDLGTGPGDIPMLLAGRHPGASITGIDLSNEMLKLARLEVARRGLSRQIRLLEADAKGLPFGDGVFDGVFSNTILHHVADPERYLREADRVRKPGGALLIRDLVRPETEARLEELVDTYAAGATKRQRQLFADSLRASYTVDEVRALCDRCGLGAATVERSSDRHLTIWLEPR
ncbi:MAG: methyltransferase domain-containing protein [Planctomycetota bacterium]